MPSEIINGLIIALLVNGIGLIVFLLGQVSLFFIFKPYREFKEALEKVDYMLTHHGRFYTSPAILEDQEGETSSNRINEMNDYEKEIYRNASDDLRHSAINLLIRAKRLPSFLYGKLKIPILNNIQKAYSNLIFLSNTTFRGNPQINNDKADEIKQLLKI